MRRFRGSKRLSGLSRRMSHRSRSRSAAMEGKLPSPRSILRNLGQRNGSAIACGGSARAHLSILWNAEQFAAADVIGKRRQPAGLDRNEEDEAGTRVSRPSWAIRKTFCVHTSREFPPRQPPGSFNVQQAMEKLRNPPSTN